MIKTPFQYSATGRLIKKFLHTKLGAYVGYKAGISGFNRVDVVHTRNGVLMNVSHSYNSRVNVGAALNASLISGTTLGGISSPLPPKYIALSTNSLTPAAGDTTLSGETAVSGLTRASGSSGSYVAPVSLDGGASYTVSNTFTAGGGATIVSSALFDAVSAGNMFAEANLSTSTTLATGDLMQVTWTVNL